MTQMTVYKGVEVAQEMAAFIRHMAQVDEYRESLQKLQAVWDNLALLGQLSGTGIDISATRASFEALSSRLLGSLAAELRRKTSLEIGFRAQVAIDILVRNLFERTADIGFLAMDHDIAAFAERTGGSGEGLDAERDAIVARMHEYVRKYSVYHDVVLLGLDGRVLARLDGTAAVERSSDPLILESLETTAAYVETYRPTDLTPGCGPQLIYSYRVMAPDGSRAVGVLCLFFRLDNECERIFANLRGTQDWSLIALVDADGRVVASSDPQHVAPGARLQDLDRDEARPLRFGGREYVAATRTTAGYQGYLGPGWRGHVMIPLEHAYDIDADGGGSDIDPSVLAALMQSEQLFPQALREIPPLADQIQADLNRAVWNGNIRQGRGHGGGNGNTVFSKALLWEIGRTGARTRDVFARSIRHLNETVVSSMLSDCASQAALAIDIMDRNLYERANDCRWWALTGLFRRTLSRGTVSADDTEKMSRVLAAINGLYTVYTDLLLFDRHGRVVAVSNAGLRDRIGTRLDGEWVGRTLNLQDSQQYAVSAFERTSLYADRHTYVYGAAVRAERGGGNVGGVAIVFDGEPQFRAMLGDALPRDPGGAVRHGCIGLFVQRDGFVVASSDDRYQVGSRFPLDERIAALSTGEQLSLIGTFDGRRWAVGARMSAGYREYKSADDAYRNDVIALILVPLGGVEAGSGRQTVALAANGRRRWHWPAASAADERIEIATFYIGDHWYGLPTSVIDSSIDTSQLVRVPGVPTHVAGMTLHGETSIPVYDLHELGGRQGDGQPRQIVILRPSPTTEPFGLLVDALGEIPELPRQALKPVPLLGEEIAELLDGLLTPIGTDAGDSVPMLMLLSMERLCTHLQRTRAAAVPAAA